MLAAARRESGQRLWRLAMASGTQCEFGTASPLSTEQEAAKRERRKQRRKQNRELRERALGWQWSWDPALGKAHSTASAGVLHRRTASCREEGDSEDAVLFEALAGVPKSSKERRKLSRAWKQWQAWQGQSSSGHSSSMPGSSSSSSSSSGRGSNSSDSSRPGSAGTSAGPRWGQADWTWEELGQSSSSSGSEFHWFSSWHEEAWYAEGDERGFCRGSTNRHTRSGGDSGCGSGSGHGTAAHPVRHSMSLLQLEDSWLASRSRPLLRQAYLAAAKDAHPDLHAHGGAGCAAAAELRFKDIQAAYQALLSMAA
ncbi:hypothetical protein ACK3TF_005577 [Chlorella vulgaris]